MKILIPYDGSKNADAALDALRNAEFSRQAKEILVVITDVWLPATLDELFSTRLRRQRQIESAGISSFSQARRNFEEQRFLAREVRRRLEKNAPAAAQIRVEMLPGLSLVSGEVLERAQSWGAELIVLGSEDGADQNSECGSGTRRVANGAHCPVRIIRRPSASGALSPAQADSGTRIAASAEKSEGISPQIESSSRPVNEQRRARRFSYDFAKRKNTFLETISSASNKL